MVKPRPFKPRIHRPRFSGIRTATETAKKRVRFVERKDGSRYPKLSSIPVSPSVLDMYKELRRSGDFHTYDELLINMAENYQSEKLNGNLAKTMNFLLSRAKIDIGYRKSARAKARSIGTYRRR